MNLLNMEMLRRFILKTKKESTIEEILENLKMYLFKIPYVSAFEIGIQKQNDINIQGYIKHDKNKKTERINVDGNSLEAQCIKSTKAQIYRNSEVKINQNDLLVAFESAIGVPFDLGGRSAVLLLYSEQVDFFDEYDLKSMEVLVAFLEFKSSNSQE